ncbi:MAG: competence/damage-inducible protein A, partial [Fimbriimonadaceae bacterium]
MRAEIVSIGTELLMGQIVDSDARAIGALLPEFGIDHTHRQTVGDNLARIVEALRLALGRSDVVFTIGGLGPTQDDLTREAIALALGDELVSDPDIESGLREFFASRKLPWVDSQLRQTRRPASARIIENPNGTAPGLLAQKDGKVVIAMPGPPGEFLPMLQGPVRDFLAQVAGDQVMVSRVLRVAGMGEAAIESALGDLT